MYKINIMFVKNYYQIYYRSFLSHCIYVYVMRTMYKKSPLSTLFDKILKFENVNYLFEIITFIYDIFLLKEVLKMYIKYP